jgi:very-short-patch-repair endonuclease
MPTRAHVPWQLRRAPFRGSVAIREGLLTQAQLTGPAWRRLFRDVYLSADAVLDHFAWCRAAALFLPAGAAIRSRSAAYIHFADVLPLGQSPVEVAVPRSVSLRSRPGLRVRRAKLPPADIERSAGLPVTTRLRTAFDLAREPNLVDAVVGVDALLNTGYLTLPELKEYAGARAGWPGSRQLTQVLRLAAPGAESPMETRLRLVLVLAGLPQPVMQYEVPAANARLDLAYPQVKLAIEYDGDHHRERRQFQRDVARLNRLRLLGWTVLRFTADDVLRHPERVVAQVQAALGNPLRPHLLGN